MLAQYNQAVYPNKTLDSTALIGLGHLASNPCMRFDLLAMNLGCNSTDYSCMFNITGRRSQTSGNQASANAETAVYSQLFNISACPAQVDCNLQRISTTSGSQAVNNFSNLTSIAVQLTVGNDLTRSWWTDDIQLSWTDDSCAGANCRTRVLDSALPRRRRSRELWAKPLNFF